MGVGVVEGLDTMMAYAETGIDTAFIRPQDWPACGLGVIGRFKERIIWGRTGETAFPGM